MNDYEQGGADHAAGVAQHALDGEVSFARIGRAKDREYARRNMV